MSTADSRRSFFSTATGIVTVLAALVTATVGSLTLADRLGLIGSKDGNSVQGSPGSSPTTVASPGSTSTTLASSGSTLTTAASAQFTTDPARVVFEPLGSRESLVTVRNTSSSVPVRWRSAPSVAGPDRTMFTATDVSCDGRLDPGRSCDVRVRFSPARSGDFTARLVLEPDNGPAREVDLAGKALL